MYDRARNRDVEISAIQNTTEYSNDCLQSFKTKISTANFFTDGINIKRFTALHQNI